MLDNCQRIDRVSIMLQIYLSKAGWQEKAVIFRLKLSHQLNRMSERPMAEVKITLDNPFFESLMNGIYVSGASTRKVSSIM